jgi:hypothetical protein
MTIFIVGSIPTEQRLQGLAGPLFVFQSTWASIQRRDEVARPGQHDHRGGQRFVATRDRNRAEPAERTARPSADPGSAASGAYLKLRRTAKKQDHAAIRGDDLT